MLMLKLGTLKCFEWLLKDEAISTLLNIFLNAKNRIFLAKIMKKLINHKMFHIFLLRKYIS